MSGTPGPDGGLDDPKENVGGDRSLVSLVQHHPGVLGELRIHHCLSQEHSIRQKQNLDKIGVFSFNFKLT